MPDYGYRPEQHPRGPRRRLTTALVAAAAAIVVAVPISASVLLRAGVIGGSSRPTMSVLDLKMFSATTAGRGPAGTHILHTTSGVQHWTVVPPPIGPKAIVEVAWVNAESARILATSTGALNHVEQNYTLTTWMTDDGGATWTEGRSFTVLLETGQDPMTQSNLDFVDPLHGWFVDAQDGAVGAPMLIFRTVDGGIRWSQVEMTPATGIAPRGALPVGCSAYGMTFLNSSTGWVVGSMRRPGHAVRRHARWWCHVGATGGRLLSMLVLPAAVRLVARRSDVRRERCRHPLCHR